MVSFNEKLYLLIPPSPCYRRPSVCDGHPEQRTVIVIGKNPATPLARDWWSYWDDNSRFDLEMFQLVYESERVAAQKNPVSPTRRRLNCLRTNGLACLETNVFRSEDQDSPTIVISNSNLLEFFIGNISTLKAVIAHGDVATAFLRSQTYSNAYHTPLLQRELCNRISQEILAF